ncbi:MAG: Calx-beta domain-containing protein, partial [Pirellulaceae bacterium]
SAFAEAWGSADGWSDFSAYLPFQRTFQLTGSPTGWNVTIDGLLSGALFARAEYSPSITSSLSAQIRIEDTTGTVPHDLDFGQYYCTADDGTETLDVSAPGSREGVIPDGTYTVIGLLGTTATGYYVESSATVGQSYSSGGLDATIDAVVWDNRPDISIGDATWLEGNNGAVTRYLTVALSNPSTQTVTVDFAFADGSALADNDYGYLDANRTLSFAPGVTEQTIAVQIYGDRKPEPNEAFVVNLSSPTNATIADGQGHGTILDDEPRISINDVTKREGKTGRTTLFTFTVTLSAAYDQAVTMSYRTVDGTATTSNSDYIAKTGTLTFAPGETTKTITIRVVGDRRIEGNEEFYLDLFGNSSNSLFVKNRGLGTILNDD